MPPQRVASIICSNTSPMVTSCYFAISRRRSAYGLRIFSAKLIVSPRLLRPELGRAPPLLILEICFVQKHIILVQLLFIQNTQLLHMVELPKVSLLRSHLNWTRFWLRSSILTHHFLKASPAFFCDTNSIVRRNAA